MKKFLLPLLSLILIALPNCGCCKKSCKQECTTQCNSNQCDKRVSGPLSEKEVAWDENDRR